MIHPALTVGAMPVCAASSSTVGPARLATLGGTASRPGRAPADRSTSPGPGSIRALSGELVTRLRGDLLSRPPVDPNLAGGLREWLGDGLAGVANALPDHAAPVVVTRRLLMAGATGGVTAPGPGGPALARAALMSTLFRQRVAGLAPRDPMAEAVAGLAADGYSRRALSAVAALTPAERRELGDELREIDERMARQWTPIPPSWLPRTRERLSVPVAGGRILLTGVADLVLGRPAATASVCLVSLRSGRPQTADRSVRRFLALLESIRSGAQPLRVATYYPSTGDLAIDEVTDDVLSATAAAVIERVLSLPLVPRDRR